MFQLFREWQRLMVFDIDARMDEGLHKYGTKLLQLPPVKAEGANKSMQNLRMLVSSSKGEKERLCKHLCFTFI